MKPAGSSKLAFAVDGAQIIARVFSVLRLISYRSPRGVRLTDLADAADLPRPTVHRILRAMIVERIVRQDPATKRYQLGSFAFELGLAAPQQTRLLERCRPILRKLANETEDTVYLVKRSAIDAVCIDRVEGSFPIRTFTLAVGDRRPLGIGAAGLALLSTLSDEDIDAVVQRNAREYRFYNGLTPQEVMESVARVRALGYAMNIEKTTHGVSGIGLSIPNKSGPPFVGVSIAAITERITGERVGELHAAARRAADELAALLGTDEDWD
ncbi:MAG: hypothetical protein BGP06_20325 [Rhizobiales bacterium 65-9]|nr:IclR family transcriptional regulator [Hyphomicrobiales bacterium]OJY39778.1 MAG: hypothetical protein BGP06_20325 [Rhizobiales bacterium 65-9]